MPRTRKVSKPRKLTRGGAGINDALNSKGNTALIIAAIYDNLNEVTRLIAAGADINKVRQDDGATPLYIASYYGYLEIVKKLIAAGADVNKAKTDNGRTPLYGASERGDLEIVIKLIEAGADVNKATKFGATPLWIASYIGHLETVIKLIESGADVNKGRTDSGTTPLYWASYSGHLEVVKKLLEAGADKSIHDKDGKFPADVAKTEEIRELLTPLPDNLMSRMINSNSENTIMGETIKDGNTMVNFHGEANLGRYYKKTTYNGMPVPKKNPYTRRIINPSNVINYKAVVPNAQQGGRRKKTRRRTYL